MINLMNYLQYPFVRNAFIVGVLISLSSALIGLIIVLKRMSFIGDGLSHISFGALSVATVLNTFNNMFVIMPITIMCAIILLKIGNNSKIKGDAAISLLSVSSLSIGYLLMNIFSKSSNITGDICNSLFGSASILALNGVDVVLALLISIIIIILFILFYNKVFSVLFDEEFAKASGIRVSVYNLIIAIIVAIVIVVAMRLVGSLLVSALLIFPALSAMRVCKTFKLVVIILSVFSIMCSIIGMIASIVFETPIGATIVFMNLVCFTICSVVGKIKHNA